MANTYAEKTRLSNGVWVIPDGDKSWGEELNHNFELLNGLLDRYTLTIKQDNVTKGTYNGTQDSSVNITTEFTTSEDIDALFPGD